MDIRDLHAGIALSSLFRPTGSARLAASASPAGERRARPAEGAGLHRSPAAAMAAPTPRPLPSDDLLHRPPARSTIRSSRTPGQAARRCLPPAPWLLLVALGCGDRGGSDGTGRDVSGDSLLADALADIDSDSSAEHDLAEDAVGESSADEDELAGDDGGDGPDATADLGAGDGADDEDGATADAGEDSATELDDGRDSALPDSDEDAAGDPIGDAADDATVPADAGTEDGFDAGADAAGDSGATTDPPADPDGSGSGADVTADTDADAVDSPDLPPGTITPLECPPEPSDPRCPAQWPVVWRQEVAMSSFSSPRAVDLNGDGVRDIVLGHGLDLTFDPDGVFGYASARDGVTGEEFWRVSARGEITGSACIVQLDGDGVPDVVIGGRFASLMAVSGASGDLLWRFYEGRGEPMDDGWFGFYAAQPLPDVSGDGVPDILVANGGDSSRASSEERPPGHIMVLSGADGSILHAPATPDGRETYMSAYVFAPTDGAAPVVLFGTGGESWSGSLWVVPLADVLADDISGAREIVAPALAKGVIAPPAVGDMDGDGWLDVVVSTFDGRTVAVDGETWETRWTVAVAGAETYATPALGDFDGDGVLDVAASLSLGVWPVYSGIRNLVIDGVTGEIEWDWLAPGYDVPGSPLTVDLDGDGLDELIHQVGAWAEMLTSVAVLDPQEGVRGRALSLPGFGPGTPLIDDIDGDGLLEWVGATSHVVEPFGRVLAIERRDTRAPAPAQLRWSAYLSTDYDGVY